MKSVVRFIALLASIARIITAVAATNDDIAIRIVVNNGASDLDGASCSPAEMETVYRTFFNSARRRHAASEHRGTKLRSGGSSRILSHCSNLCAGFEFSACFVVDPRCKDERRAATTGLSSSASNSPQQQQFSPEQQVSCQRSRQLLIQELDGSLESSPDLSNSCRRVMQEKVCLTCVTIPSLAHPT
jgi:hypothetical protein